MNVSIIMIGVGILGRVFLGSAKFSEDLRAELAADGLVLIDEGLSGSITFRNYRAPGKRFGLRKTAISGAIAVSRHRLVVWVGKGKHIDVPHAHPLRKMVEVSLEDDNKVCFGYDPAAFDPQKSGRVEVRLRTANARQYVQVLTSYN